MSTLSRFGIKSRSPANAARVFDLYAKLGVNTHFVQGTTEYATVSTVVTALNSIGFKLIRDGTLINTTTMTTLHSNGIGIDAVWPDSFSSAATQTTVNTFVTDLLALAAIGTGTLRYIEHPNEPSANGVTRQPVTWNGVTNNSTSYLCLARMCAAIYTTVKANGTLNPIGLISTTYGGTEPDDTGLTLLNTGLNSKTVGNNVGLADICNTHPYADAGDNMIHPNGTSEMDYMLTQDFVNTSQYGLGTSFNGYGSLALARAQRRIVTEFGYPTTVTGGDTTCVNQLTQAKVTINGFLTCVWDGWEAVIYYDLFNDSAQTGRESTYGLFLSNATAKTVATCLANMLTIIGDSGPNAATFNQSGIGYAAVTPPAYFYTYLVQHSNGTFFLLCWANQKCWTSGTPGSPLAATPFNQTINFTRSHTITVYDPILNGTTAISGPTAAQSSVTLSMVDHLLIVAVTP